MALIVADLSIELIEKLRPLVSRIKARDKSLADQIQRAAPSVALNIGETVYSDPGNRRARFHGGGQCRRDVGGGACRLGVGHRFAGGRGAAVALLDRILPMLWKLTRG